MGSVNVTIENLRGITGPRGGDLTNPRYAPEYRNSPANVRELEDGVVSLHRFDTAVQGRMNEQPWHRMAALLMVQGKTAKEIAEVADVSPSTVAQLNGQLWFQELKARFLAEASQDITARFRAEAAKSLDVLVALRDNSENEKVVAATAVYILDQAAGKAVQRVVSVSASTSFKSEQEEVEALQRELDQIRALRDSNAVKPRTSRSEDSTSVPLREDSTGDQQSHDVLHENILSEGKDSPEAKAPVAVHSTKPVEALQPGD